MLKHATAEILSAHTAPAGLTRTAHRADFSHHEVRPGYLYVRSRAISSRCNENFDEFPADQIAPAYHTFIGKPVFVNHVNEDHRRARGVIIDAALHRDRNPDGTPDTWVEVLMEVDGKNFPKLAEAILAGKIDRTSMGCDVEYSICSACGNKATTPAEYCIHIPGMKGRPHTAVGSITGARRTGPIREICYGLRFFENSLLVEAPADPTAHLLGVDATGLGKTAGSRTAMPSNSHPRPAGFYSTDFDTRGNTVEASHQPPADPTCRSAHLHDVGDIHYLEGYDRASVIHPESVASLQYATYPCGRHVFVYGMETKPSEQRKGYASALMDDLYSRHPHAVIEHGDRTPEGRNWWSTYQDPAPHRSASSITDTFARTARYPATPAEGPVCPRCTHVAGTGPGCPRCDTIKTLKGAVRDLGLGSDGHDMHWQLREAGPTIHGTCRNCGRTSEVGAPGMHGDNSGAPSAHAQPCPAPPDIHRPDAAERLTRAVDYIPGPRLPRHLNTRTAGFDPYGEWDGYGDPDDEDSDAERHERNHAADWDDIHENMGDIHRGIGVYLHPEDHAIVHDKNRPVADRVHHLLGALPRSLAGRNWSDGAMGTHWTTEPYVAEDFAEKATRGGGQGRPGTAVVFHAHKPDREAIDHHPSYFAGDVYGYHDHGEREVPIHPGAGVSLKGISFRNTDEVDDEDGGWQEADPEYTHHEFGGHGHHVYASALNPAEGIRNARRAARAEGLSFEYADTDTGGSKYLTHRILSAVHPEHGTIGTLKYWPPKTPRGPLAIDRIEVHPDHRRQGVASALMDQVQRMHPASEIRHGDRTPAGRAFWDAYSADAPRAYIRRGRTSGLQTQAMPPRHEDPSKHPFFVDNPVSSANVLAHWHQATEEEKAQGMRWYSDAHLLAHAVAHTYAEGDVGKVAGVLSAYSPRSAWAANMHNAVRSFKEGRALDKGEGVSIMGVHHAAAQKIMDGEDYDRVLKGPKTNAFARLIHHGGVDPDTGEHMPHVVIDRHALSVAAGKRLSEDDAAGFPSSTPHYYNHVAKAYQDAAKHISDTEDTPVAPHQLQAVTWLTRIRLNRADDLANKGGGGKGRAKMQDNVKTRWQQDHSELLPGGAGEDNMHMAARYQYDSPTGWSYYTGIKGQVRATSPEGVEQVHHTDLIGNGIKNHRHPEDMPTPLYHGTRREIPEGAQIEPGHPGNFARSMKHVYMAETPEDAWNYAAPHGHVYEVRPTTWYGHRSDAKAENGYWATPGPVDIVRKVYGPDHNPRTGARRVGYGETKAPAQVDTLRNDACDVCGNTEGWDGHSCPVCQYVAPPVIFRDPDTSVAREMDLRGTGDSAAQMALNQGADAVPGGTDASQLPPDGPPADDQQGGPVVGGEVEDPTDATADGDVRTLADGDPAIDASPTEPIAEPGLDPADVLTCPACGYQAPAGAPVSAVTADPMAPASAGPVAGDVCPQCGQALLLSAAELEGAAPPPDVPALDPDAAPPAQAPAGPPPGQEPPGEPEQPAPDDTEDGEQPLPDGQPDDPDDDQDEPTPKSPAVKRVSTGAKT